MNIRATLLTVTLSVLIIGCATSQTSGTDKAGIKAAKESICQSVSGSAEIIMKGRLNDIPIKRMLGVFAKANKSREISQLIKDKDNSMIVEAYRRPNLITNKQKKEQAIRGFGSEQYLKCVKEDFAAKVLR